MTELKMICRQCGNAIVQGNRPTGNYRRLRYCDRACMHASQKYTPEKKALAFWRRVRKGEGCWPYLGAKIPDGYGWVSYRGTQMGAHRVSWILTNGEIPNGLHVLHRCDNPICVNPHHLFLGTHAQNIADKITKGRHTRGETAWSAKLNDEKVREMRRLHKTGVRICVLARQFGVAHCTATLACSGRTWKHVR